MGAEAPDLGGERRVSCMFLQQNIKALEHEVQIQVS